MGKHKTEQETDILVAARKVFAQYGFRKVTMDDIARDLDMTRSSLYYYYKNKEDIFLEVVNKELSLYAEEMNAAIDAVDAPEEKLTALASNAVTMRKKFINMYKMTSEDIAGNYEMAQALRNKLMELLSTTIAGILRIDRDLGDMPGLYNDARLLSMSMRGIVAGSRNLGDDILKRILVRTCTVFYHGLRSLSHEKKSGELE